MKEGEEEGEEEEDGGNDDDGDEVEEDGKEVYGDAEYGEREGATATEEGEDEYPDCGEYIEEEDDEEEKEEEEEAAADTAGAAEEAVTANAAASCIRSTAAVTGWGCCGNGPEKNDVWPPVEDDDNV